MANNGLTPTEMAEYLKKLTAYYNSNGEGKLLDDIIATVNEQKRQGKLTDESIINMTNTLRRFLNNDQKARLDELLNKIINKQLE